MFHFFIRLIFKGKQKGRGFRVFTCAKHGDSFVYQHVADSANFKGCVV